MGGRWDSRAGRAIQEGHARPGQASQGPRERGGHVPEDRSLQVKVSVVPKTDFCQPCPNFCKFLYQGQFLEPHFSTDQVSEDLLRLTEVWTDVKRSFLFCVFVLRIKGPSEEIGKEK